MQTTTNKKAEATKEIFEAIEKIAAKAKENQVNLMVAVPNPDDDNGFIIIGAATIGYLMDVNENLAAHIANNLGKKN